MEKVRSIKGTMKTAPLVTDPQQQEYDKERRELQKRIVALEAQLRGK
jgi:hypothetical protein